MCPITRETVEAWLRKNTNRMGTFIADQWVLYIRAAVVDVETLRSFNTLCLLPPDIGGFTATLFDFVRR
jgi:hypothetical protein